MAALFAKETFESGSTPWTFTSVAAAWGSATVALDTTSKVVGANSLKFGATGEGSAQAAKKLGSAYVELYVQFKVFIPTAFAYNTATSIALAVIRNSTNATDIQSISIDDWGDIEVTVNNITAGWADTGATLSKNAVHKVEIYLKRATSGGAVKVWIDNDVVGSPNYNSGSINTGSTAAQYINVGIPYTDGSITNSIYIDDVIVDSAFIGAGSANAAITQTTAALALTGGTQVVAAKRYVGVTQVAGTLALAGGTQAVTTVNNGTIAQTSVSLALSGGAQVVVSTISAAVTQVTASLVMASGTQAVIAYGPSIAITQTTANLVLTGGTQVIATSRFATVAQVAIALTATGGTQTTATVRIVAISQVTANILLTGGTQSVTSAQIVNSAITQVHASLALTGGTQAVAAIRNVSIAQVSRNLALTDGTQVITIVVPPTLTWKGYTWYRRDPADSPGSPMYNGQWDMGNVSAPDGNDYVTLTISNPTGNSPYGAEMFTVDPGNGMFGYGTYMLVVGTRLDILPSGVVFGGLFTYEDTTGTGNVAVTNNEIDVNETSDWGEGTGVNTSHNYFKNVGGTKTGVDDPYATSTDAVTTHVMKWESGKLTFDSYVGAGTGGTNLKHTVATSDIPVPTGNEFVDINAWVFEGATNNPDTTPATSIILRDFSFTPPSVDVTQASASLTSTGGTQAISATIIANASITQLAANLSLSGGVQTVSVAAMVGASVAQLVANLLLTGNAQVIATVRNGSITQIAAALTLSGGTQVIASIKHASISQSNASLHIAGGTQSILSVSSTALNQVAAELTITAHAPIISINTSPLPISNVYILVSGSWKRVAQGKFYVDTII